MLKLGDDFVRHFGGRFAFGIHDKRSTFAVKRRPCGKQRFDFRPAAGRREIGPPAGGRSSAASRSRIVSTDASARRPVRPRESHADWLRAARPRRRARPPFAGGGTAQRRPWLPSRETPLRRPRQRSQRSFCRPRSSMIIIRIDPFVPQAARPARAPPSSCPCRDSRSGRLGLSRRGPSLIFDLAAESASPAHCQWPRSL